MPDHQFEDRRLAGLYDFFCPWDPRGDFGFYFPLVMAAESVLDVGCGTGMLLHRARERGHQGRLCGLDPAAGMLEQARRRTDVEWVLGDLSSASWDREFDLVVMTGHAFQVLVTDNELCTALTAIHTALAKGGRFVFETRNPLVRAWERWTPENAEEIATPDGAVVRMEHRVDTPVTGDLVSFTTTYTSPAWLEAETSHSTLRFLDAQTLERLLAGAGFGIDEQYGDWDHRPFTAGSPEIITIARRG